MHSAFIARQPIFDRKLDVAGYELLFRGRGYAGDGLSDNPQRATATVVLNSFTELELTRIVGRKTAWVNVGREFVVDGLAQVIPPGLGGLEISESEEFDDELVDALRDLKAQGYRLALDGFGSQPHAAPVLELFDVVKLNALELGHDGLSDAVERLRGYPCQVLAHRVATHADHEFCADLGCDLFQGYFFCQPAVVATRQISANRLALLQVVAALQRPGVELSDVEQLVARDVALSFRMLRYVNSAFFGVRSEVRSIGHALALLGLDNARRWATLSVLASVDDKPTELTLTALTRARFCELAGAELELAGGSELFTLGLFSVVDALMDTPMQDVVESLGLADDMREALVHRRGPLGELLDAVAAREQGENGAGLALPHADELYLRSVIWANTAAESLFGAAPAASSAPAGAPVLRPEPAPVIAAPVTAAAGGGPLRRFLAAIGRRFGRRA
ncbi:MAG TPA: HDOD domain-containing protein [Solirubrobacteraceae bacterium]|jgi:EAL and modified HD-GYP domain-containing signal transduction protein